MAYAGGNLRDWLLETATTTRPAERGLGARDVDAPPPIVLGVPMARVQSAIR